MKQYIDKDALVAEIERLFEKVGNSLGEYRNGAEYTLISMKDFIDTLEVKEVDLNEEIESYFKGFGKFASVGIDDCIDIAKHFFELGIKVAQKGE